MDDLLAEAAPFVHELGAFSLREAAAPTARQEHALRFLWDIFRALPSRGAANAVGITKAVKLVTLGRIGPALDTVVRTNLRIQEPRSADEWIAALHFISLDLANSPRTPHIWKKGEKCAKTFPTLANPPQDTRSSSRASVR